jgi:hypothetical protein
MKPDWDSLANDYKDSPTVLVADVDCTAGGKSLCEKHGVKGYPTIKTYRQGDTEGETYEGGRDLADLKKHVETLGPACSIDNRDLCSEEQLPLLDKYAAMSQARRDAKLNKLKNAIAKLENEHEKLQRDLTEKFQASKKHLEELQERYKPEIKMLVSATPKA